MDVVTLLKLRPAESFSLGLSSCSWASRMSTSCSIRRTEELTSPAKMGPLVCLANSLAKLAAFSPLRICRGREWIMFTRMQEDKTLRVLYRPVFDTKSHLNKSLKCQLWKGGFIFSSCRRSCHGGRFTLCGKWKKTATLRAACFICCCIYRTHYTEGKCCYFHVKGKCNHSTKLGHIKGTPTGNIIACILLTHTVYACHISVCA